MEKVTNNKESSVSCVFNAIWHLSIKHHNICTRNAVHANFLSLTCWSEKNKFHITICILSRQETRIMHWPKTIHSTTQYGSKLEIHNSFYHLQQCYSSEIHSKPASPCSHSCQDIWKRGKGIFYHLTHKYTLNHLPLHWDITWELENLSSKKNTMCISFKYAGSLATPLFHSIRYPSISACVGEKFGLTPCTRSVVGRSKIP